MASTSAISPLSKRLRPIRDVSRLRGVPTVLFGLVAGLTSAAVLALFVRIGWTQVSLELFFGGFITHRADAPTWWLGFAIYLLLSALTALLYAYLFRSSHRTGAVVGLGLGGAHWLIAGLGTGVFSMLQSRSDLPALHPGAFVLGAGFGGAAAYLFAHLIYGCLLGVFCDRLAVSGEYPAPIESDAT